MIEEIEAVLEVTNLIIAIVIAIAGIGVYRILNGDLKKAWTYTLITVILFALHEVIGSIEEWGLMKIDGAYVITEFIFILAFVFAIFAFRKLFINLAKKNKK